MVIEVTDKGLDTLWLALQSRMREAKEMSKTSDNNAYWTEQLIAAEEMLKSLKEQTRYQESE